MVHHQKTQIDFTKYRTPELVETIVEIISLPGAFRSITRWAFYGLIALMILVGIFLKLTGHLTIFWIGVFELYSVPAGAMGGLAIGIAEFIRRSLDNMTRLVDLLLNLTQRIALDTRGLTVGEKEMPPVRDLIDDVYHEVILVTLKEAVSSIFPWVGRPIYWLYHLTLNQFVRIVIRMIPRDEQKVANRLKQLSAQASDEEEKTVALLQWIHDKLNSLGGWVKFLVMMPCYTILAIVIGIVLLPLAIVFFGFMVGAETPPPPVGEVSLIGFAAISQRWSNR